MVKIRDSNMNVDVRERGDKSVKIGNISNKHLQTQADIYRERERHREIERERERDCYLKENKING